MLQEQAKPTQNQGNRVKRTGRLAEWRNSLSAQLLIRFWWSLILFFILVALIQYKGLQSFLMQQEQLGIKTELGMFANATLDNWLSAKVPHPPVISGLRPGNVLVIYSRRGLLQAVIEQREQDKVNPAVAKLLSNRLFPRGQKTHTPFVWTVAKGRRFLVLFRAFHAAPPKVGRLSSSATGPLAGYAVVLAPLAQMDTVLEHELRIYGLSALVMTFLGGLAALFLVRKPLKPLRSISDIAAKIAAGEYNLRLPTYVGSSEIDHLGTALNHMLSTQETALHREQSAREEMARFIADSSHELRTPLTSIRGFLEILLRNRETNPESLDSAHRAMLTETERLIHLTEDLLTLDRLALLPNAETGESVSMSVSEALPELVPLLESLVFPRRLTVRAEELALPLLASEFKQILFNLVQNAAQHTPPDAQITLELTHLNGEICLSVSDNGEGISPEDLPYVFERFYRGSRSRQRSKGQGAGLGLAIVREILRVRGGQIDVKSERGVGSSFSLHFPIE